jgi:hypothetical protein
MHSVSASLRIYIQNEGRNLFMFGKDHSGMQSYKKEVYNTSSASGSCINSTMVEDETGAVTRVDI